MSINLIRECKGIIGLKHGNLINSLCYFFLLFLIIGFNLFAKSFSKLHMTFLGIPIYITETIIIFIFVLCLLRVLFVDDGKLILRSPLKLEFILFYLIFFISLFTGFFLYQDLAYILRQSALFYYSIFYFLVILTLSHIGNLRLKFIFVLFFSSCNIVAFLYILNLLGIKISIKGLGSAGYFYISLLLIIEFVYLTYLKRSILRTIFFIDTLLLLVVTILYGVRGNWVAVLITIFSIWLLFVIIPGLKREFNNFNVIIFSFVPIIIFFGVLLSVDKPDLLLKIKEEFLSFFNILSGRTLPSINARWRLITWREMFDGILGRPVFGYGFGKKFISQTTLNLGWTTGLEEGWVEAHNYCLSFLYRSGFLGLGAFFMIIGSFFKKIVSFLRICKEEKIKIIIISLLCCIIYILVLGFFEVVLEIPYLGSFLWIIMGLVIVIINNYSDSENRLKYHFN